MSELSIDVDAFLALPIIVKRRILSFLSPWDLLNVAECNQGLHSLVVGLPKRAKSISDEIRKFEYPSGSKKIVTIFKTAIEGWNGSRRRYVREIGSWPCDVRVCAGSRRKFIEEGNEYISRLMEPAEEFRIGRERQKWEMEILLRNGTFDKAENLSVGMFNWGIRATSISIRPTRGETAVRQTIVLIEKTKATRVVFLPDPMLDTLALDVLASEPVITNERLFTNETIRSLSSIDVNLYKISFLPYLNNICASRLIVEFGIWFGQADAETVVLFVRRMIEEWLTGTRDIEEIEFGLPDNSFADHTQEAEFADRLTKGFDGNFIQGELDPRLRLIRRNTDALGLVVWCNDNKIGLRSCNYEFRRSRGRGTGTITFPLLHFIRQEISEIASSEKPEAFEPQEHESKLLRMIDIWREETRNVPDREIDLDLELFVRFGRNWSRENFASRLRIREYIREFETTKILPAAVDYSDCI